MRECEFVYSVDEAKICLAGLEFPATKEEVLSMVEENGGPEAVIVYANQIPQRIYQSLDEVVDCLESK